MDGSSSATRRAPSIALQTSLSKIDQNPDGLASAQHHVSRFPTLSALSSLASDSPLIARAPTAVAIAARAWAFTKPTLNCRSTWVFGLRPLAPYGALAMHGDSFSDKAALVRNSEGFAIVTMWSSSATWSQQASAGTG
jgi:hypothetical protein